MILVEVRPVMILKDPSRLRELSLHLLDFTDTTTLPVAGVLQIPSMTRSSLR